MKKSSWTFDMFDFRFYIAKQCHEEDNYYSEADNAFIRYEPSSVKVNMPSSKANN